MTARSARAKRGADDRGLGDSFLWSTLKYAVLNLDDKFGAEMVSRVRRSNISVVGYGFNRARSARARDSRMLRVQGQNLCVGADGLAFDVSTPWGAASLKSRLIGRFNAANLLGSLAALLASDVSLDNSVRALHHVKAVPGRTERYGGGSRPLVIVDYAHTPDALQHVLLALREMISRHTSRLTPHEPQLICVFGCGGERDRGKRPLMGAIAAALADQVIITSDNPRGEDPDAIITDIVNGRRGGRHEARVAIEPDRARAIRLAVGMARRGDIVLVAGKGHEQHQEIGGIRHVFSDAAVVTAALRGNRG